LGTDAAECLNSTWESDHLIFTPAACSDLMQLLDQKLQLLGFVHILAVGLTWQRSWTRRDDAVGGLGANGVRQRLKQGQLVWAVACSVCPLISAGLRGTILLHLSLPQNEHILLPDVHVSAAAEGLTAPCGCF